jgi:cytochrome c556
MNRLLALAGALALAIVAAGTTAGADDKDKPPSIKEIMTKAHKGGDAILSRAKAAAKKSDFDELSKHAATLVKLGSDLSRAKPKKGEAESWKELTADYVKKAKALQKAAKDKDETAATESLQELGSSCSKCHKAHKVK